jgi:ABC-type dipeptide/oligopeptide/nickel transport system permease subunit
MTAFLVTIVLLGLALLWLRAWMRHSKLALGIVIGAIVATAGGPLVRSLMSVEQVPLWLPPLPFALVATTLFGFGILAWIWADD